MILIICGRFQHELDFIYQKFNLKNEDVCYVSKNYDCNLKVIYTMNDIVEKWYEKNEDSEEAVTDFCSNNKDKIVVVHQRGCGIVPIDERLRKLRDYEGKVFAKLAQNADEVYSVTCGLGLKIKG